MAPPDAPQFITIRSPRESLHLVLCPEIGGSIAAFFLSHEGKKIHLMRPYDPAAALTPLNFASFPLTPFSNRICDGSLHFRGETFNIRPLHGKEPHALHGDGWRSSWTVSCLGYNAAMLALETAPGENNPYVYKAEQVFTLTDDALSIDLSITNLSGRPLPFGMGHHPYFPRTPGTVLKTRLPKVWQSKDMVPQKLVDTPPLWDFSAGATLSDERLGPPAHGFTGEDLMDHGFQGWNGRAEIIWPETSLGLVMTADPVFSSFVIYVPAEKPFFCAEAVTNIIDGFNLMEKGVKETGTVVLNDGESFSGRTTFTVSGT